MTDDETDDPEAYECDECGATYLTERQLRAHQSKHSSYFEQLRDETNE